jgi:magnesium transporter
MRLTNLDSLVEELTAAYEAGAGTDTYRSMLEGFTAVEAARVLDELEPEAASKVFESLPVNVAADALGEAGADTRNSLLRNANRSLICQILDELPMDDAAMLVAELRPHELESILGSLPAVDAREVRELLAYPENTAGRMMTEKFAAIRREMTVGQTLAYVSTMPEDIETVHDLYVLSADGHLIGVCSLRQVVTTDASTLIGEIMQTDVVSVNGLTPARDVANLISEHDFLALPVVDGGNRMLGIVTVDDIIDFLTEEFEEMYMRLAGTDAEELDRKSPTQIAKLRLPWILATMTIELFAGMVIHAFDQTLTKVILLASFMPIISAISGNTGLQSAAIIIRGLSTGHVNLDRWRHALSRQIHTTALIGAACGTTLGLVGGIWDKTIGFGIVVGIGMFAAVNIAGVVGTLIPFLSKRMGFDPALTAGPFETAFQDVIGISIFLGLATLMLPLLR